MVVIGHRVLYRVSERELLTARGSLLSVKL